MRLVDLSLEIYHRMPRFPTHPPIIITPFGTHQEIRQADGYAFSSATLSVAMGDHTGTHVDAPAHFDARPGARAINEMPRITQSAVVSDEPKTTSSDPPSWASTPDMEPPVSGIGASLQPGRGRERGQV